MLLSHAVRPGRVRTAPITQMHIIISFLKQRRCDSHGRENLLPPTELMIVWDAVYLADRPVLDAVTAAFMRVMCLKLNISDNSIRLA